MAKLIGNLVELRYDLEERVKMIDSLSKELNMHVGSMGSNSIDLLVYLVQKTQNRYPAVTFRNDKDKESYSRVICDQEYIDKETEMYIDSDGFAVKGVVRASDELLLTAFGIYKEIYEKRKQGWSVLICDDNFNIVDVLEVDRFYKSDLPQMEK
jgi:hypothetical protein